MLTACLGGNKQPVFYQSIMQCFSRKRRAGQELSEEQEKIVIILHLALILLQPSTKVNQVTPVKRSLIHCASKWTAEGTLLIFFFFFLYGRFAALFVFITGALFPLTFSPFSFFLFFSMFSPKVSFPSSLSYLMPPFLSPHTQREAEVPFFFFQHLPSCLAWQHSWAARFPFEAEH